MKPTISELFDEFMFECEFSRKNRPETLRGYRQTFSTFQKLMPELSLESLSATFMTRFFKVLHERKRIIGKGKVKTGVKKSTIAIYWSKLNTFFGWLQARNYLQMNPFASMTYPTPTFEDRRFLTRQSVEKIINALHNHSSGNLFLLKRNLAMFYTLLFCGVRREELLSLQIRDLDFDRKVLRVRAETSKIPITRHIPLHSQLIMYLKDYLRERRDSTTPYLFVSGKRDDRLTHEGVNQIVKTLKKRSGIKFHLHQFRHTFAVNFLKSSNNVVKLKQLLGHKNINMTMIYVRCLPTGEMREDVENMSIDSLI